MENDAGRRRFGHASACLRPAIGRKIMTPNDGPTDLPASRLLRPSRSRLSFGPRVERERAASSWLVGGQRGEWVKICLLYSPDGPE